MNACILILTNVKNKNFFVSGQNIEKALKKANYEKLGTYFKKLIGASSVIVQINDGKDGTIKKEDIYSIIKTGCIINGQANPWNLIMPYIKMFDKVNKDKKLVTNLITEPINDMIDAANIPPRVTYLDNLRSFQLLLGSSLNNNQKGPSKLKN